MVEMGMTFVLLHLINEWLIIHTDDVSTLSEVSEEARSRHLFSITWVCKEKCNSNLLNHFQTWTLSSYFIVYNLKNFQSMRKMHIFALCVPT